MKIFVDDIPEGGLSLDLSVEGKELNAAAGGDLDISFVGPIAAHLELTKAKADVAVTGEISARMKANCSRCLKEIELPLEITFSDFFVRGADEQGDRELKPADLDVDFLEGPELDTLDIILAQIALEAPTHPLCKPDCPGLCPRCGADLNKGPCACPRAEKVDPRLAALKDFKAK
ncbi:MAG: DUF177 domain-containing protein [Thermodesulfobacteriota bacterium]